MVAPIGDEGRRRWKNAHKSKFTALALSSPFRGGGARERFEGLGGGARERDSARERVEGLGGGARDDTGARPQMKRQGSVSVDAAYRAMPTHRTPTEFDAKGSSGQSAWAGMMPDAAAAPPTPVNRASKWPGWKK